MAMTPIGITTHTAIINAASHSNNLFFVVIVLFGIVFPLHKRPSRPIGFLKLLLLHFDCWLRHQREANYKRLRKELRLCREILASYLF